MIEYNLVNKSDYVFDQEHVSALNPGTGLKELIKENDKDLKIDFEITYQNGEYILSYTSNDKSIFGGYELQHSSSAVNNSNALSNGFREVEVQIFNTLNERINSENKDYDHYNKEEIISEKNQIVISKEDVKKVDSDQMVDSDIKLTHAEDKVKSSEFTSDDETRRLNESPTKETTGKVPAKVAKSKKESK